MNHNSRYDVSKRKRRDVPEELLLGLPPFGRRAPRQVFYPFPILLSKSSVVPGSEHSKKAFRLFAPFRSLPHGVPRLCRPVRRVVRPDADYGVRSHCQRLCAEPGSPHRSNREINGAVHRLLKRLVVDVPEQSGHPGLVPRRGLSFINVGIPGPEPPRKSA